MGGVKRWQFWVGVAISLVFLYLALRGLRLDELGEAFTQANYWWVIPGVAVYFVDVWARAWRWHYLLKPLKSIPTKDLFPTVTIGYFGNNILPARAGELLRAIVLKKDEGSPDFRLAGDDHRRACLRWRGDAGLCVREPAGAGLADLQLWFRRRHPLAGNRRDGGLYRRAAGFPGGRHVPGAHSDRSSSA